MNTHSRELASGRANSLCKRQQQSEVFLMNRLRMLTIQYSLSYYLLAVSLDYLLGLLLWPTYTIR